MEETDVLGFCQNLFEETTLDEQKCIQNLKVAAYTRISAKLKSISDSNSFLSVGEKLERLEQNNIQSDKNLDQVAVSKSKLKAISDSQRFAYLWSYKSSNNTLRKTIPIYSPTVFTIQECETIINDVLSRVEESKQNVSVLDESHTSLIKNESSLEDPLLCRSGACAVQIQTPKIHKYSDGWYSSRHSAFPTVDFPVEKLSVNIQKLVYRQLDYVIKKFISENTGIRSDFLVYRDLFIVKYSEDSQRGLVLHSDGCLISFNILLNNSEMFSGGGTFFEEFKKSFAGVQGTALVHDSSLMHSGIDITNGCRYILVGFVDTIS
ncbi:Procollagen-lysine,2-oxoglutarate 5-dioxygenase 2 [Smittium mucronatum]|uniref:Procollagen-lysine,2-oxoglutarate 5-dioxygenase 2 n=1 Tax=Smittium mucronatum TaxID=133383 RepID=A0A1R0GX72_9FUNG|nr:Procollagen-lysine,2-oxoglutarate 5-dioxygenase 2 [Smittium mucronatum]